MKTTPILDRIKRATTDIERARQLHRRYGDLDEDYLAITADLIDALNKLDDLHDRLSEAKEEEKANA